MSSTKCVAFEAKALMLPLFAGTIAMFEVIAPSNAFNVDTNGCGLPWGDNVRKPSVPCGTTVAFKRYDCADAGAGHPAAATFKSIPVIGGAPAGFRVSSTRQGLIAKSESPLVVGGAKKPLTSITRSEELVTNTSILPFVPAGTMAALAVTVPVGAFNVDTRGCD